ncbi:polysaccharide pyruvyl transferase family protein [uncultured Muribaculum sp.]|uniref:polysaccharide pyruvyl transferase family protein n=1 Tax=uncultured Muribaculum sp. TaxID=1918613 RepID=UPI0025B1854F|nr:polysaccharide pyruvyl transferase family protein [uncultured Muribaculum sp.]
MKVGILSMQQITNYGSFLQAYGLKSIIEGLGHEVEFIDIVPGEQLSRYRIGRFHKFGLLWKRLFVKHPLRQLRCTLKLHKRFDKEFKPELGVGVGNNSHFDAVVIGSDEVFNIAQTTWFGFSTQLFGEDLNADKVLSYAGCFGATTLGILKELNVHNKIGGLLKQFSAISVRDENSANIVVELTGARPYLNVDPVIAYGFEKEIRLPEHKGRYMLVYTYPGRMNKPDEILAIKKYARSKGLRIISNANYFDWVDEVITPHPFEVLGYFLSAECIVTDTFHGAVMSLKYNKPFSVIVRGMNSNKLTYLLEQFGLKQRIVGNLSELATIMEQPVDYDSVNAIINVEKERTIEYLKDNLQ